LLFLPFHFLSLLPHLSFPLLLCLPILPPTILPQWDLYCSTSFVIHLFNTCSGGWPVFLNTLVTPNCYMIISLLKVLPVCDLHVICCRSWSCRKQHRSTRHCSMVAAIHCMTWKPP
jgi:hypothetical protein